MVDKKKKVSVYREIMARAVQRRDELDVFIRLLQDALADSGNFHEGGAIGLDSAREME